MCQLLFWKLARSDIQKFIYENVRKGEANIEMIWLLTLTYLPASTTNPFTNIHRLL